LHLFSRLYYLPYFQQSSIRNWSNRLSTIVIISTTSYISATTASSQQHRSISNYHILLAKFAGHQQLRVLFLQSYQPRRGDIPRCKTASHRTRPLFISVSGWLFQFDKNFVFCSENEVKDNIQWNDGQQTVSYNNYKSWVYNQSRSCAQCSQDDLLMLPNAAFLVI
jgi:hypothetical protein